MEPCDRRSFLTSLTALPFAACDGDGALAGLPGGREGVVTDVMAGDRLRLDGKEALRLASIEAPEDDHPYAQAAKTALQNLALGRRVAVFFSGARADGEYTLAQVADADRRRWLQATMLDAGAARVRTRADNRICADVLLTHEARARGARRGLWTLPLYDVRLPGEIGAYDYGFMVVEGRVRRVGEAGERLYLDFSEDWRSSLSADIPRGALRSFRTAGQDPYDLEGRLIRIRGAVSYRRLLLDHPEQIEMLEG